MPVDGVRYDPLATLKARQPSEEVKRQVSLIVAAHADTVDDCRDLLSMLGLLGEETPE